METLVTYTLPKADPTLDKWVSDLILAGHTKKEIKSLTYLHFGYINQYLRKRATDEEREIMEGHIHGK